MDITRLTNVATDLVTQYGPRYPTRFSPYVDDQCTLSSTIYDKNNLDMASDYVKAHFESMGYPVELEAVTLSGGYTGYNVIATKTGTVEPDTFIEVGAHIDTVPSTPGAGDNASGATAVVELARVLEDYQSRRSIRFIAHVGEESGQTGSNQHLDGVLARGEEIKAGLIMDGIGWSEIAPDHMNCIWQNGGESLRIANLYDSVKNEYSIDIDWRLCSPSGQAADNVPYWNRGFPAILSIGGLPYSAPGYHGCGDTMATVDIQNVYKTAQQNLAVLMKLDAEAQTAWVQTDWVGGAGQFIWADETRYDSATGVDDSIAGQLRLSEVSGGDVLFSDDFARPPTPAVKPFDWIIPTVTTNKGVFDSIGGTLNTSTSSTNSWGWAYTNTVTMADYSIETDIRFPSVFRGGGIEGRLSDAGAGYAVFLYPSGSLGVYRYSGWGLGQTHLGTVSVAVGYTWHHLKVTFSGNQIQVFYDYSPTPNLTVTDATYGSGYSGIAIYATGDTLGPSYNNYVVRDSTGTIVLSDDFGTDTVDPLLPWVPQLGTWTLPSDTLQGSSAIGQFAVIAYTDESWTDFTLEGLIQLPPEAFAGCIGGRADPITGAHYTACVYPEGAEYANGNPAPYQQTLAVIKMTGWTSWSGSAMATAPLPTVGTDWHTLRLDFLGDSISVAYDGVPMIQTTDGDYDSGGLATLTYGNGSAYGVAVDDIAVSSAATYGNSGTLLSSAFDGGSGVDWQTITWDAVTPAGTSVSLRTRTADAADQLAAAPWSDCTSGSPVTSEDKRWIQYEAMLTTSDPPTTPELLEVTVYYSEQPTAITLVSFTAEAGADGVTLAWETGTEVDNAGFNLYRATAKDGPWTKINDGLFAAQGDAVAGASYSFADTPGYGTFYYQLEDVDYYGVGTLHGPVWATAGRTHRLYLPLLFKDD